MKENTEIETPVDGDHTVALLVQVPRTVRKQVRVAAARNDLTISEFVTRLLAEALCLDLKEDDTIAA